ncbi:MAG: L,D-transpeptidase/peptidoglycan binding protein [Lachnospiraceae bacterium]|nr:L,D-transpeptidase/peptidoglycan binding protein [Lachnospiraceae bacterium]
MGKVIKWCLGICAALVVALIVLVCVYLGKEWNRTTYFKNTTIDGYDVSEMTPDEVVPILKNAFTAASVSLKEGDKEEAVWSLEDLGYTVDETALKAAANEAMEKQKSSIPVLIDSMMNGNAFEIEVPFLKNAGALTSAVTVSALADERIANKNAEMTYDQESKTYSIIPEIQGTQLNDADIQHLVQLAVDDVIGGTTPEEDITVQIPQEMYLVPDVLSTDAELNMKVNTYNAYDKAVITYVFGEEKETIDWDTISNWIVFENGEGYLSEEKLREYVMTLGQKYNTIYYNRSFNTSLGTTIQFGETENNYGYLIDEEGEYQQLLADIQGNSETEREPVYAYTGIDRSGTDDMRTYVEVNISMQHLWFYKEHALVIEGDVVTGCVAKKTETQTGIYPIAYKESPATLIPSNETNGTPVTYWMPFYDGQGLHDANWRQAFGGQIYQTSGSHGCVNMPRYLAETIFNQAPTGTPVVLYK